MRLLFAGTPEAAVPALRALLGSSHEVVAVLTRPDARAGRGRRSASSPVKDVAVAAGVPVLTPTSLRERGVVDQIAELGVDAAPIVAYGGLVPPAVLALPRHGWINLHFSLLPAWRGAAPVQHAIMAGDEVTGASTFVLEEGLDTGPILGTMTETIRPDDTAGTVLQRLAEAGAGLLVATLDAVADGSAVPVPQPAEGVSHAPKVSSDDARIDWRLPAHVVGRRIRGCTPAPGAWSTVRGDRVKVGPGAPDPSVDHLAPGELEVNRSQVRVGTGAGGLVLGAVQPPGKKPMPAADWARGARLDAGERFDG